MKNVNRVLILLLVLLSVLANVTHGQVGPPPVPTIGYPASWPHVVYLPILSR